MSDAEQQTERACKVEVSGLHLRLRLHHPIAGLYGTVRYDVVATVHDHDIGVVCVTTTTGLQVNTIHTEQEVLEAVERARTNHINMVSRLGQLAGLAKSLGIAIM